VVQRAHWVQQQAMKESGTLIRIHLDFKNSFNLAGHSCLWAILRGLGVPDVDILEDLYSQSWMKITVGMGCSALIQLDTGTVQGSVLSDLFLNALLRLLDATGITQAILGAFHDRIVFRKLSESARDYNHNQLVYGVQECYGCIMVQYGNIFILVDEDYFCH